MRLLVAPVTLAALAAALPATAAATPHACLNAALHERVVARNADVVVLKHPLRVGHGEPEGDVRANVLCYPQTGRRVHLADDTALDGTRTVLERFTLAGPVVAFVQRTSRPGVADSASVGVRRPGAPLRGLGGDVQAFVLDRSGAVAAITETASAPFVQSSLEVLSPRGRHTQADVGAPGALTALTLASGRVRWRHGGTPASTPLTVSPGRCPAPPGGAGVLDTLAVLTTRRSDEAVRLCVRATGVSATLPAFVSLAGTFALVDLADRTDTALQLVDLTTVRPVGPPLDPRGAFGLDPSGAVVVLAEALLVREPDGSVRELGRGDISSVALDRGVVSWVQDGAPHLAPL